MSDHKPPTVGAPSELAEAHEMPGCVQNALIVAVGVPVFLFRELPTLPLDALVWAYEQKGLGAALVVLALLIVACGGLSVGMMRLAQSML